MVPSVYLQIMAIVLYTAKSPHVEELKRGPQRHFRIGEHTVTMKQRWQPGGYGGTALGFGASVYDAAFVLADHLHRGGVPLEGKRVVELGTGPGLVAVAAAILGAAEVIATDGDEELLNLTAENLDDNVTRIAGEAARRRCCVTQLMWGDQEAVAAMQPPYDVILAADVAALVYEEHFSGLVSSLAALSTEKSIVLLAYHRRHKTEDSFFDMLSQAFTFSDVLDEFVHPEYAGGKSEITIFRLQKRPDERVNGSVVAQH
jgi:predicted nicotinamide N-methyase